jgi:RecA-family ATPase
MEGLPIGYATGTFGHGGAGKSQIELMRAVCIAAGLPFCGLEGECHPVTFLSCEDRADIHHWRLSRICRYLRVDRASLDGWLNILDLVGHDSLLYAPDPRGGGNALTGAYGRLAEHMKEYGSEALFVDGISDTYGGNENAGGEVKRFVNSLLALIPPETGAVLLIGHVNKLMAGGSSATTEGYSGSTSWHNSCRARWYLRTEVEQEPRRPRAAHRQAHLRATEGQPRRSWRSDRIRVGPGCPSIRRAPDRHVSLRPAARGAAQNPASVLGLRSGVRGRTSGAYRAAHGVSRALDSAAIPGA